MLINARESPLHFYFFIILSFIKMAAKRKKNVPHSPGLPYCCEKFKGSQPYPTPRQNGAFIGAAQHNPPIQPVLNVPSPESCRPHNLTGPLALADWSFCWKLFVSSIWKSGMLSRWWLIWQNCSCDWIYSCIFSHIYINYSVSSDSWITKDDVVWHITHSNKQNKRRNISVDYQYCINMKHLKYLYSLE